MNSWLPAATLVLCLTAPALAGGGNGPAPTLASLRCAPVVCGLRLPPAMPNARANPAVQQKIQAIVDADQQARKNGGTMQAVQDDRRRREARLPMIPQSRTPREFVNIALVFQHGSCVDHVMLANRLAQLTLQIEAQQGEPTQGGPDAAWLYVVSLDRALMFSGRAQKYGTARLPSGQCTRLYAVDPRTTAAERARYGVRALADAPAEVRELSPPRCK